MNTKNIRQFEKYYNDEMGPEEKASFEKLLSEDLALSAAFKEYLSIYEALNDRDTLDLRIKLKEIREENARKKLQSKNLDLIVLNSLQDQGAGFKTLTNKISVIFKNGQIQHFPVKPKREVAQDIIAAIISII